MGAQIGGKRVGRRHRQMSDINVTPLVDVMLVLLIIFMVTAPLLTVGVQVELPKTKAPQLRSEGEKVTITVNSQGKVKLQETEVDMESLVPRLQALLQAKPDEIIYVRGDKNVNYGRVMEVMGVVSAAGYSKLAFVTDQQFDDPKRKKGSK
jgi:biopolymer transport protein TolR